MESSVVLADVLDAFRSTEMPPSAVLMNEHCRECVDTSRLFWDSPGSFATWEVAARREGTCIEAALLTPEAWRYYLPALMTWCVRDTEKVDVLVDNLVHELTPRVGASSEWFAPRAVGFSTDQRRAICSFLAWYQAQEATAWSSLGSALPNDVSVAIDYWRAAG
jgi:hypothetical protein